MNTDFVKKRSSFLEKAGNYSRSTAINSMMSSNTSLIRAGVSLVPFLSPNLDKNQRNETAGFNLLSVILTLGSQFLFFKAIDPLLNKISTRRLHLEKYSDELKVLSKFNLNHAYKMLKRGSPEKILNGISAEIQRSLPHSNKTTINIFKKSFKSLVNKINSNNKSISSQELFKRALDTVKTVQGSNNFLRFVFGVCALGCIIRPMILLDSVKPLLKKFGQKEKTSNENSDKNSHKFSLMQKLSITTAFCGTLLGALCLLPAKGRVSGQIKNIFHKIAKKENSLGTDQLINRGVGSYFVLRTLSALCGGNSFLGMYMAVTEGISLIGLKAGGILLKKGWKNSTVANLHNKNSNFSKILAKTPSSGLVKAVNETLKLKGNKADGMKFILSHLIDTYLILGLITGVISNYISEPLRKKFTGAAESHNR